MEYFMGWAVLTVELAVQKPTTMEQSVVFMV
jgi:hypothetical protein